MSEVIVMNTDVCNWMAQHFKTDQENIKNILKSERATTYLLIWPIFEQDIFNGFMKVGDIMAVSSKFSCHYSDLDVEEIARKFHARYQDSTKYKHLIHKNPNNDITVILKKKFDDLSECEKLQLLFFVAYRYRNNIFHGNKKVLAWNHYTEQIDDCMKFMTEILDVNSQKNIIRVQTSTT